MKVDIQIMIDGEPMVEHWVKDKHEQTIIAVALSRQMGCIPVRVVNKQTKEEKTYKAVN